MVGRKTRMSLLNSLIWQRATNETHSGLAVPLMRLVPFKTLLFKSCQKQYHFRVLNLNLQNSPIYKSANIHI